MYMLPLSADTPNPPVAPSDEEPASGEGRRPGGAGGPGVALGGEAPAPPTVNIDFTDINERAIPLPMGASDYGFLEGVRDGALYVAGTSLLKFDLNARTSMPI